MKSFNKTKNLSLIFLSIFISLGTLVKAQGSYVIKGKIQGLNKATKVYLSYVFERDLIRDSAMTEDGNFIFKGKIQRPLKANLQLQTGQRNNSIEFYLSPGTTTIQGSALISAAIKGGKAQEEYANLTSNLNYVKDSVSVVLSKIKPLTHQDSLTFFKKALAMHIETSEKVRDQFILANRSSYVSYDLVSNKAIAITEPDKFIQFFNAMDAEFRNTAEGKAIEKRMILAKKFDIGQPAVDFVQNNTEGKPVSLSSFKGKYVLVDFWASWCGPCRLEYPHLKKAYAAFKDKNFEIIGISLDDKKSEWLESIKANGFEWTELCDLKGKQNDVALTYGIAAIPQCFLINPEGIIIAKNLRGNALFDKLSEILK